MKACTPGAAVAHAQRAKSTTKNLRQVKTKTRKRSFRFSRTSMDIDEVFTDEGEDWNCEDANHDVPDSPKHRETIETMEGRTNGSHNAFSRKSTSIESQRGSINRNGSDKIKTAAEENINEEVLESGILKPLQPSNSLAKGARVTLHNVGQRGERRYFWTGHGCEVLSHSNQP